MSTCPAGADHALARSTLLLTPSPVPVPSSTITGNGGPGLTDYLTGWGTIALAVVTVLAVWVTVHTARTDRRRDDMRRADDREDAKKRAYARQLAQARLVVTSAPEISKAPHLESNGNSYQAQFQVANYGDRPVMGIEAEVWVEAAALAKPCTSAAKERYLLPGDNRTLEVPIKSVTSGVHLRAWRIRWTDADGYEWCVDQAEQPEPLPYSGQLPHPR